MKFFMSCGGTFGPLRLVAVNEDLGEGAVAQAPAANELLPSSMSKGQDNNNNHHTDGCSPASQGDCLAANLGRLPSRASASLWASPRATLRQCIAKLCSSTKYNVREDGSPRDSISAISPGHQDNGTGPKLTDSCASFGASDSTTTAATLSTPSRFACSSISSGMLSRSPDGWPTRSTSAQRSRFSSPSPPAQFQRTTSSSHITSSSSMFRFSEVDIDLCRDDFGSPTASALATAPEPLQPRITLTAIPELQGRNQPQQHSHENMYYGKHGPPGAGAQHNHDRNGPCAQRRRSTEEVRCDSLRGRGRSCAAPPPALSGPQRATSLSVPPRSRSRAEVNGRSSAPDATTPRSQPQQLQPQPRAPSQPPSPGLLSLLLRHALVTHLSKSPSARSLQQQLLQQLQPRQQSTGARGGPTPAAPRRRPAPAAPLPGPPQPRQVQPHALMQQQQQQQQGQPQQDPLRGPAGNGAAHEPGLWKVNKSCEAHGTRTSWSQGLERSPMGSRGPASPRASLDASAGPSWRQLLASPLMTTPASSAVGAAAANVAVPPPPFTPFRLPARDGLLYMWPGIERTMRRRCWRLEDYQLTRLLHQGYAGEVYKAICIRSRREVVLKTYTLDGLSEFLTHQVLRELFVHSQLEHPGVVQIYGAFKDGPHLVLVLQYVGGGPLDRVRRRLGPLRLSEPQALHLVLLPLLRVLAHLHGRRIVHRDIKPDNLLFTPDWALKLCDFGVSVCLDRERAVTRTGSGDYMAPEIRMCPLKQLPADNKSDPTLAYTPAVDVWSLGVLAYSLLVGFPPFPAGLPTAAATQPPAPAAAAATSQGDAAVAPGVEEGAELVDDPVISAAARCFVASCLQLLPEERPTVVQLLQHPWVRSAARSGGGGGGGYLQGQAAAAGEAPV